MRDLPFSVFMELILNEQESIWLETTLKKFDWWIPKGILKRIEQARRIDLRKQQCEHSYKRYTGFKTMCASCSAIKPGTTISFTLGERNMSLQEEYL